MRKAYRRKGGPKRSLFYAGLIALSVLLLAAMLPSIIARLSNGIPISRWNDAWAYPAIAWILGLTGVSGAVMLKGPKGTRPIHPDGVLQPTAELRPQRFPTVRRMGIIVLIFHVAFAAMGTSFIAQALLISSDLDSGKHLRLGMMIAIVFGSAALWQLRRLLHQTNLTISLDEVRLDGPTVRRVNWSEITEIRVAPQHGVKFDPELDRIDILLHDRFASPNHPKGLRTLLARLAHPPIVSLKPWERYDVSPATILGSLDCSRPATVPIHDPRRIMDVRQI